MKYLTGTYALNLHSPDDTPGDWHYSALDWRNAKLKESSDSIYKDWGLYKTEIPLHGTIMAAKHIRACLDLIEDGFYSSAQGMREYFIADDSLNPIIFSRVWELRNSPNWDAIDRFMGREYRCKWLDFKKGVADAV